MYRYFRVFFSIFIFISGIISFGQNSIPNSFDLYYSTKVNTSLSLELIVVDNNLNDNITYSLVSNPANGTASLSGSTVTYTPSNNYIGTDTFTFKANDGTADSDTKTVSIKVFKQYKTSFELLHTFKGESAEDGFGRSVAISDDNNTIAIGAFRNDGGGSNSGHVRVFRKSNGAWLQMGNDIDGENAGDYSGVSVDLSADGNVLAVGAYLDDNSNGTNKGQVKVYKYQSNSWSQLGDNIEGQNYGDEQLGWQVALSADGNILAASAWKADYAGRTNNGVVRAYSWDGSSWTEVGDLNTARGDASSSKAAPATNGLVYIGSTGNHTNTQTLTESWDGTSWSETSDFTVGYDRFQEFRRFPKNWTILRPIKGLVR